MAKLTMTQFKALTVDQQYSAYDDSINLAANHQTANEDFAVRIGLTDASKATLVESHKKAIDELNTAIAASEENLKATNEQIATLTKDLADETSKRENMEGHPDVVEANVKARAALKAKLLSQLAELE